MNSQTGKEVERFEALQELGDGTRLRVFLALLGPRKNVSQIVSELGLVQPQVSYHLRKLKQAGLAVEQKDGRWVWYQANWSSPDRNIRGLIELMSRWAGADESGEAKVVSPPSARDDEMEDFLLCPAADRPSGLTDYSRMPPSGVTCRAHATVRLD